MSSQSKPKETATPPTPEVVERNIRTLIEIRQKAEALRTPSERFAEQVGRYVGTMGFIYLHLAWIGGWIAWNTLSDPAHRFDAFPFGLLSTVTCVEAIVLSTFVLITQNRMSAQAERRADLDLQVNLLAEHEVTQILAMLEQIHRELGVSTRVTSELHELKQDVAPEAVLEKIDEVEQDVADLQKQVDSGGCL
jgi:uncharacterized membrane protein